MITTPHWSETAIELIAHRFKLLSETSRLRLLYALQDGDKTVGELIEITKLTQANVSHQLVLLADGGLIRRHKARGKVWYRLADPLFIELKHLVCGSLLRVGSQALESLQDDALIQEGEKEGTSHVAANF